ncbi:MAG TPA: cytochrome d ubiquinol oxidase subunit II [Thermomicrobiaceae bacterium]|nr:cytochrome d ubiquinol oxidase subunit II [Thermomicrobiaceae bacterium]
MPTVWFALIAFMVGVYVLLDGFDLGAGVIHLLAARTPEERRQVVRAVGPVWDGNEVWLLAAGGAIFAAFPLLYASSFSGFYLPLIMVLWMLMLRGLAIELRAHIDDPLWTTFWDALFFLGSLLLAVFFGAALGNVVRGVPLDAKGYFFEPLWTTFNPRSAQPGILDWYTVLIGVLALATLVMHGANYVALKTEGALNERSRRIGRLAWAATALLTVLGTVATFWLRSSMWTSFTGRPWGFVFPVLAVGGLLAVAYFQAKGRELASLLGSGAYILGMLTSTAFAVYPNVLPAVDPANSLTVSNAAAPHYGLVAAVIWWGIAMVLAAVYFVFLYRMFRGKVRLTSEPGY